MNVARLATVAVAVLVVSSFGTVALAGASTAGVDAAPTATDPSATIDHEGDALTLRTAPGQTIAGTTTLDPGTELRVVVRSTGASPFLITETTSVDGDGNFSVTMDFSNVDAEEADPAIVSVRAGGEELTNASVTFEPGSGNDTGETTAAGDGPDATIDHQGDALTLETESNRTITGSTTLDPGTTVTVMLRGSGEQPFLENYETTVDEDGEFSVTADLATLHAGKAEPAVVMVRAEGEVLTRLDVTFEPGPGPEPDEPLTTDDGERPADEDALETGIVHVRTGETVAIPVTVGDDGRATLVVGGDEVGYEARFRLVDGDGDGRVTVLLDTGRVGPDVRRVDAESDADSVGVPVDADPVTGALDPGDYPLAVYPGPSTDEEPTDVGTLVLSDPGTDPGSTGDSSSENSREAGPGSNDGPGDTTGEVAPSRRDDGLPANPSVLGLTAIAVVSLSVAGAITVFRR